MVMKDTLGRNISYLRVSVTDLCNLRCRYCMPAEGIELKEHSQILSYEHMLAIIRECAAFGINRVRLTGGEPLVRKGVIGFISAINKIEGIKEVNLTTNGVLLGKYARQLKDAGVDSVNISLDSLNRKKFKEITRLGELGDVLNGIEEALKVGFEKIKINVVAMKGFNDDEIMDFVALTRDNPLHVRFIELMSIGEAATATMQGTYMPAEEVRAKIPGLKKKEVNNLGSGPAEYYGIEGYKGLIGFINPISSCFCDKCNRIRLTSDGKLIPCLHSGKETDLKSIVERDDREALREAILKTIEAKPEKHNLVEESKDDVHTSDSKRYMSQVGG